MYPLGEQHSYAHYMQVEMMQEIEGAQPTFVVVANLSGSWASPELSPMLQDWAQDYLNSEYEISGVVDILSHEGTVFLISGSSLHIE